MEDGIPSLQDRQMQLEPRDFLGIDYPPLYLCKPKRGIKRDESKVRRKFQSLMEGEIRGLSFIKDIGLSATIRDQRCF
ncbi:hypothetical protein GDO86_004941 [Hymenochirus boettgeri]|uniref:Uncharacterized protein n=1 Tax=Hymenochirus boettgeri TaxID=247094 RepID=A0A8T2J2P5_9PIPI|nr:hypothetical protein GDO86_004941 [Hymenochirus boettgeri]